MKKNNNFFRGVLLLFFLFSATSFAQFGNCNNSSLYITSTAINDGFSHTISTCHYSGEYSILNGLNVGDEYTFTHEDDGANLYITIRDNATGVNLGEGYSPLSYIATTTSVQLHWNNDTGCGSDTSCRDTGYTNETAVPPPAACESAIPITCDTTVSGDTTTGSIENNIAFCGTSLNTAPGIWYVLPGDGNTWTVTTDTFGSGFDTKLGVFSSTDDCATLTCVGGDDDTGGSQSEVIFDTNATSDYYIYVTGWSSNAGAYTLNIGCVPGPTCSDGIQNGDEEGIDCGGSACADCPPMLCESVPSSNDGSGLTSLTVQSEVFPSAGDITYEDFTGTTVDLDASLNANVELLFGHTFTYNTKIWIDFNDDLEFDTNTEEVFSGVSPGGTPNLLDASFTVPATADLGVHIMRIGTADIATPDPCYNGSWGVTMDVEVKIVSPPCVPATVGTTDIVADCTAGSESFSVDVEVIANGFFGYQIFNAANPAEFWNAPAPGTYTVGPFDDGESVELMYRHLDETCTFSIGTFTNQCPPSNDECPDAIDIACGDTVSGTTTASTFDNVGFCGTSNTAPGVWYRLVGDGSDIAIASTCNQASYDTKISVFSGNCGALACIAGNDDSSGCSSFSSEVMLPTDPGVEYFILIHGYSSATGDFDLTITCVDVPENDLCEDALPLACGDTLTGTNIYASDNGEGGFCNTSNGDSGVWYVFEGNGTEMTVNTCNENTDYDTKLHVYSGECGTLECKGGDDDDFGCDHSVTHSIVTFFAEEGTTYYVYVNGFSGATGNFVLTSYCSVIATIEEDCNSLYYGYDEEGDDYEACADLSVDVEFGTAPYTYLWSDGSDTADITVCPSETTVYSVTVTDAVGGTSTAETTVVVVDVTCKNDKVQVCHVSGNGDTKSICISADAVQAHLDHGDVLGDCDNTYTCDTAPSCDTTVVSPANGSEGVSAGADISWTDSSQGIITGYVVSVGTSSGGTDVADSVDVGTATSYDPGTLSYDTTYYVTVAPYNEVGVANGCSESSFTTAEDPCAYQEEVTITITFDNFAHETAWTLSDENGVVASGAGTFSDDGATITETVTLCGTCYDFEITDTFGDGICCAYGTGSYSVANGAGVILASGGEFDNSETTNFCLPYVTPRINNSIAIDKDEIKLEWNLYPNPTKSNQVNLGLNDYLGQDVTFEVLDFTGKVFVKESFSNLRNAKQTVSLNNIINGVYIARLITRDGVSTKQLIVSY